MELNIHQKDNMHEVKRISAFALTIIILGLGILYFFQEKLIFHPEELSQEYRFDFIENFEEFFLESKDGARLNGLHFKVEHPRGVILYYHGNAGNLQRWGKVTSFFLQFNYDVIVMDYRTYGKSSGKLSEEALYNDAQMFYDKAKELYSENKIVVYGRSLGTTFATYVASVNQPKQLILESPFYALHEVGAERFPFLPVKKLLKYAFPTAEYMSSVDCNVLILHGSEDDVVPIKFGKKLYKIIPKTQGVFVEIKGGSHNDLIDHREYRLAILKELK